MTGPRTAALPLQGEPVQAVSPALPLAYFALAVSWLCLGALGLVVIAPELASGNLFAPRVFAVTHAFTIGVLMSTIFGALHQFLQAVVGVGIRHPRVAAWGYGSLLLGLPVLVYGFWQWRPAVQAAGWLALFAAVGFASWNVLPARRRAVRNRYVGGFVTLAHSALGTAMILAGARIGHGLGWWELERLRLLSAHLHLGLLGFGTLTSVAFTSKMLPAFLGSPSPPESRVKLVGWVASIGLLAHTAGAIATLDGSMRASGALMLAAGIFYLALLAGYFRGRRSRLEPGLGFIAAGTFCYAGALAAGTAVLLRPTPPGRLWAAYLFLAIVGWLCLLIVGVMHRVGPRLVTLLLAQRRVRSALAYRAELIEPRIGWSSLALAAAGILGAALGILLGNTLVVRAGAVLHLGGALLVAVQAARLYRLTRPEAGDA